MKFQYIFRIVSRNDYLDAARVPKWRRYPLRMKQRVPCFPIISVWEFQKFKLNYLENGIMKFRENFATAATSQYLLLMALTQFLLFLSVYGGAWNFLNFRHYKSMAISKDNFKVHCLRNNSFKFWITYRIHTYIRPLGSGWTARRWKMFSARDGACHVPISTVITLWRFWHAFSMPLTQKRSNKISRNFQGCENHFLISLRLKLSTPYPALLPPSSARKA